MTKPFRLDDLPGPARDRARDALLGIDREAERSRHIREKEEQAACVKMLRTEGFKVYPTSQYRPSKVAAGIPDLWCVNVQRGIAFWFETKRQVGGVMSEIQHQFAAECAATNTLHGSGDRYDLRAFLQSLGARGTTLEEE